MTEIAVTGGTGYIGSHCCVAMIEAGLQPVIIDDLSNSSIRVLDRIEQITGVRPTFIEGDIRDTALLDRVFSQRSIEAVMHFAAFKSVSESVHSPLAYYTNNVTGTLALLDSMKRADIKTFVFSSSATVYGAPPALPIKEDSPLEATNPYGRSKLIVEEILQDLSVAEPDWRIARLRYFNPAGAHPSGLIGEDPTDTPNNLLPYIAQVAVGRRDHVHVFGNDYPTRDGTGLRDYIHIMDLVEGHVAALDYLRKNCGLLTVNLGTGTNTSVLEIIAAFERASGQKIDFKIDVRRSGDVAACWADPSMASALLGWKARRNLEEMCNDHWCWQSRNPTGYC